MCVAGSIPVSGLRNSTGTLGGYAGASLPLPPTAPRADLVATCVQRCCGDNACAAATMQVRQRNDDALTAALVTCVDGWEVGWAVGWVRGWMGEWLDGLDVGTWSMCRGVAVCAVV